MPVMERTEGSSRRALINLPSPQPRGQAPWPRQGCGVRPARPEYAARPIGSGDFQLLLCLFVPRGGGIRIRRPGIKQLDQRLIDKTALMLQVTARG